MTTETTNASRAFLPEQVGQLITRPVAKASVAIQATTVIETAADSNHKFRVPVIGADPSAEWTPEGDEITPSDATLTEAVTDYYKLAGLSIITSELADDSSPEAAEVIGAGLARDIARKLDTAFFGTNVTAPGPPPVITDSKPAGLEALADVNHVTAPAAWADLDPFTEAIFEAEGVGATLTSFVANPADALLLAQLKETSTSYRDLLQPDATKPGVRLIGGVPLLVSPAVTAGTIWGLPSDRTLIALRKNVTLTIDRSAYFSSDRVGIRAILRIGWVFPHPAAIQKISLDER